MKSSNQDQKLSIYSKMIPPLLKKGLLDSKKKKKSFSLIDLGCGSGDLLYVLKKDSYLKEVKIFGLDIDKKAISAFKKKLPGAKAILADALSLKMLRNRSFNFVICNQVVEHVEDDKVLVSEINRILKKSGLLFIASVLKKWYGLYWHRNKFGQVVIDPDHKREYASLKEFRNLLTKRGFDIKNLNVNSGRFPLVDYFLLFLAKVGVLRFTNLRDYYLNHPGIYQLSSKMLFLPIPGYATIEALAEKK